MDNVIIYYGPPSGFEKILEENEVDDESQMSLSELVRLDDESRTQNHTNDSTENKSINNLVSFSDEYASINKHAILNFDMLLSRFSIGNMFLHNPPQLITKKMKKKFPGIIKIKEYQYDKIDEDKICDIYSNFENKIVGQNNAKWSLLRALVKLVNENKPKPVVILFYGPSGVGKTETAKYLAEMMGGNLFRKQFSMFQNNDYATYLFGGSHSENSFAKEILERETNVLLLDEFDKVNQVFHSAFYQLFEEGIFEDKNYRVDVRGAIIICTSNYLSEAEIKNQLGDPIYSRIDACIKYEKLTHNDIINIIDGCVETQFDELPEAYKPLIDKKLIETKFYGVSNKFKNARKINSSIQQMISDIILKKIISDKEHKGT